MLASSVPLFRRSVEDGTINYELPAWSLWVILLDLIVFVPLLFFVSHIRPLIYYPPPPPPPPPPLNSR